MVPVFVRQHVALGERSAFRPELRLRILEEPEVDVDLLVGGAVERADVRGRRPRTWSPESVKNTVTEGVYPSTAPAQYAWMLLTVPISGSRGSARRPRRSCTRR